MLRCQRLNFVLSPKDYLTNSKVSQIYFVGYTTG